MKQLFLPLLLLCFKAVSAADSLPAVLGPGENAPTFSLPSLTKDRVVLRHYCGQKLLRSRVNDEPKIVILNFWATYCAPCQKEIPELVRFQKKYKEKVKLICISIDKEGKSLVKPFVREKKYDITVGLDPYLHTAKRYNVYKVPALFVLDHKGVIRYSQNDYDELLVAKLEKVIDDIEKGRAVVSAHEVPAQEKNDGEDAAPAEVSDSSQPALKSVVSGGSQKAKSSVSARIRWQAVAAVECGRPILVVAQEVGATPEEIRSWYDDLKKAATEIWKAK
ncbi:MAG: TlpA disulfide reductase family protein [Fibrobacterota bacterium]